MDLAVIDSDVLIHLVKLEKLFLLKDQFLRIYITDIIYMETVTQGIALKEKDAFRIKEFFNEKLIIIKEIKKEKINEFINKYRIHEGEASIIALAIQKSISYFLSNEIKVRELAKSEGFKVVGSIGVLLRGYKMGKLSKKEIISVLEQIKDNKREFRINPKIIDEIFNRIK
ncbi:MAG: hypothetical protein GF329_13685 [Candidatus Lokiarchaeota archaeon]|nr:hypothetical protein [Candidatus Lokiarchaeota archaeon]